MQIQLSPEDEAFLDKQVQEGRFTSVEEALRDVFHLGLGTFIMEDVPKVHDAEYLDYLNQAISEGLADIEAGRVVSSEDFFRELRARRTLGEAA